MKSIFAAHWYFINVLPKLRGKLRRCLMRGLFQFLGRNVRFAFKKPLKKGFFLYNIFLYNIFMNIIPTKSTNYYFSTSKDISKKICSRAWKTANAPTAKTPHRHPVGFPVFIASPYAVLALYSTQNSCIASTTFIWSKSRRSSTHSRQRPPNSNFCSTCWH